MNPIPTTPPALHIGYSTYRSKRHSRTSSASVVPTEQSTQAADLNEIAFAQALANGRNAQAANGTSTPGFSAGSPSSNNTAATPPANLGGSSSRAFFSGTSSPSPSTRATSPTVDVPRANNVSPRPPITSPGLLSKTLPPVPSASTLPPPAPGTPRIQLTLPNPVDQPNGIVDGMSLRSQTNGKSKAVDGIDGVSPPPTPSTSAGSQPSMRPPSLRSTGGSTFRHIPARTSKPPTPSPLRPSSSARTFSTSSQPAIMPSRAGSSQHFSRPSLDSSFSRPQSQQSIAGPSSSTRPSSVSSPALPPINVQPIPERDTLRLPASSSSSTILAPSPGATSSKPATSSSLAVDTLLPPTRSTISNSGSSIAPSTPATPSSVPASRKGALRGQDLPATPLSATSTSTTKPTLAPYRPGFQPKGVYSVRTDEFMSIRAKRLESRRAEEKRLFRRLEKLVDLHFSPESSSSKPPSPTTRRASSFLDFSELKGKGASDLWKGVVESTAARNERQVREAEQRITRWEDDNAVSACPICTQAFHPLTNRKHHCRLCGRVVCSLPPKSPIRPKKCSLLIIADHRTGKIEEAPDIIAYGVAPRSPTGNPVMPSKERDMHLKGVRICRDCNVVVQRHQFALDTVTAPAFSRLHKALLLVEQQIEESLPQFQEAFVNAKDDTQGQRSIAATRKDMLEMFAQYDTIAKRIRALPSAPGTSQDKLQNAVMTRASLFLQQNMFPLKRLAAVSSTKPRQSSSQNSSASESTNEPLTPNGRTTSGFLSFVDQDSALAHSLQPLLEQEALLESYVDEAMQARKFEDAQTLKFNLDEIRAEIERIARDGNVR
ncbi:carboxypeptidase Y-deficient [Tulasnella sp. 427]|nr:carboxypeptidase Y-deficient [Tulasnella sp. 427]